MTEDTVIELAKQAGFLPDVGIPVHPSNLFKFAALVAAAEREKILEVCKEGLWDAGGIRNHLERHDAIRSRT